MNQVAYQIETSNDRFFSTYDDVLAQSLEAPPACADYREILRAELHRRIQHNRYYSLRAFARDLQLSPSRVSEILNHKQGLSRKAADKVAARMRLPEAARDHFLDLVTASHARSPKDRQGARMRLFLAQMRHADEESGAAEPLQAPAMSH